MDDEKEKTYYWRVKEPSLFNEEAAKKRRDAIAARNILMRTYTIPQAEIDAMSDDELISAMNKAGLIEFVKEGTRPIDSTVEDPAAKELDDALRNKAAPKKVVTEKPEWTPDIERRELQALLDIGFDPDLAAGIVNAAENIYKDPMVPSIRQAMSEAMPLVATAQAMRQAATELGMKEESLQLLTEKQKADIQQAGEKILNETLLLGVRWEELDLSRANYGLSVKTGELARDSFEWQVQRAKEGDAEGIRQFNERLA